MALIIKDKLYCGDSYVFRVPGFDGRTCVFSITNQSGNRQFTAVQDADSWLVAIGSGDTATVSPGSYRYHIGLLDSGERETLQTGWIELIPDLAGANVDTRTHEQKTLEAIKATLEGKAGLDQLQMSINGRSIQRYSIEELLVFKSKYESRVNSQIRRENAINGKASNSIIKAVF